MKTVKTLADATRMAAQSGATLEVGGRTINAGGARMAVVRSMPTPEPAAPVEPQADPMERMGELMGLQSKLVAAQGEAMQRMVARVMDRLEAKPEAPKRMTRCRPVSFEPVRDEESGALIKLIPNYLQSSPGQPSSLEIVRGLDGMAVQIIPVYQTSY